MVKMNVYLFILLIFSSFGLNLSVKSVDMNMIIDVIKSYERPTGVVAKLCWSFEEKLKLSKSLMNGSKSIKVLFIDNYKEILKFDPIDMFHLFDLSCNNTEEFLDMANKNSKFNCPSRWFFINSKDDQFGIIPTEINNLNMLVNTEVLVSENIENDTVIIHMVYRINPTKKFIVENYGVWTKKDGLQMADEMKLTMVIRRRNLEGIPIAASIVSIDNETKYDIESPKQQATDNLARYTYQQIKPTYDFINATKVLVFTNTWGYYINKTWNGMVGDIINGNAELCGTISYMRLDRTSVVTYITQPVSLTAKFVFREPPLSFQNNLYRLPFKSTVWLSVGGLILILIAIIYVNSKWEITSDEDDMKSKDPTFLQPNVSDIAIFVMSAVTQQGSDNQLKGTLGRVVSLIMFLIFLFLYTSYSANIVALLQSSSDQIRTLSDLLNSRFEIGVEDEPYARYYFTTQTDPIKKAIYENKIAKMGYKPNFMGLEEGVLKLRNKDAPFAFHMNLGMGYRKVEDLFLEHEKCNLREIEYISNGKPWLCCKKMSPYREMYKIGALRTFEHGLSDRINHVFYVFKPYCTSRGGSFGSVNMVDFHPVLLLLLYGMAAAVVLLGLENLMYRKLRRIQI